MAVNPTNVPLLKRGALNLFRRYRHAQVVYHELTYLFWECTLRCDLCCRHCGSDCRQDSVTQDMPLADFLRVLDEVKDHQNPGKITLALTGGEPLMRDDLETCGAAFRDRGFGWGMVSNGYDLTRERFERLLDSGLRSLTISLDGLEVSHDWLRRRPESFQRALAAIALVGQTPGLISDVVTCVNQKNLGELEDIKRLLVERDIKKWRLFTIFPKGRAEDDPLLDVSGRQLRELLEFIRRTREEGEIAASYGCEGFLGAYEGKVRDTFFWCRAGVNVASVLADGSISACPSLRGDYIQGNIYQDRFWDCWENRFQVMRDRSWTKTGCCSDCSAFSWCEGNGLHLRDQQTGHLLRCHLKMLEEAES